MKKRILTLCLTLLMLCFLVPATVNAEEFANGSCGKKAKWILDDGGTLTISGSGAMYDYKNYGDDAAPWILFRDRIKKVVVKKGITSIGDYAFYMCGELKSVKFPESLTAIGESAFSSCRRLSEMELPSGLTKLEKSAFANCDWLRSVNIPKGVKVLRQSVFYACSSLDDVTLPASLTTIEAGALKGTGLVRITFPDGLKKIGQTAFASCRMLSRIYFSGDVPSIHEEAFRNVDSIAYFPSGNSTWTSNKIVDYGGALTWKAWCPEGCNYEVRTVEASCSTAGGTYRNCPDCGEVNFEESAPAFGHDFIDDICNRCGYDKRMVAPEVATERINSTGKIRIEWRKVDKAVKYKVYYAEGYPEDFKLLKTVTGTKLNHTSAKVAVTYYYRVVAVDANGNESEPSNNAYADCTIARPVISLSNDPTTGKVKISWDAVEHAEYYDVYAAENGGTDYKHLGVARGTSFLHGEGVAGVKYRYMVQAIGEVFHSYMRPKSAESLTAVRTCDIAQPKITISANSAGKNKISWYHLEGAVKYEVYCSIDGGKNFKRISTTTNNSIVNTSSEVGKTYHYKVRAIGPTSASNSVYSKVKSRTVQKAGPEVSISLTSKGKPSLSWKAVSGASKYQVYYSTDGYSFKLLKTTTNTKLTHSSAQNGTLYRYVVKAVVGKNTRSSSVVFAPCVDFSISNAKSAKSVLNCINEYREEYGVPKLKWHTGGLDLAKIRAVCYEKGDLWYDDYTAEVLETYDCYMELSFYFDGTAEDLVDIVMYNYDDFASLLMLRNFEKAAVAKYGDCWVVLLG